jgi:hypothetical protein
MPSTQLPRLNSRLTHLCADVGNFDWIPILVDCFPESTLQVLSMPGCSRKGPTNVAGKYTHVDHLITKYMGSLNTVRFLRAWETDFRWIEDLNDQFQGIYTVQELVLGTRNPSWYYGFVDQWRRSLPKPKLSHYLCGFELSGTTENGRWGNEIKRIRIDHISILDLDISVLSEPFYSCLKVLMLQPAPRGTCNKDLPGCKTIDEAACAELAQRIIEGGASSLRVIVITSCWFWVSRDNTGSEHGRPASTGLWKWADAKGDSTQNRVMASIIDKLDLEFLECSTVPFWHERDSMEWHRNLASRKRTNPYSPSIEMLNQWNYLTMLPSHEE